MRNDEHGSVPSGFAERVWDGGNGAGRMPFAVRNVVPPGYHGAQGGTCDGARAGPNAFCQLDFPTGSPSVGTTEDKQTCLPCRSKA